MAENKALERLDSGLTVTQRELIERLVSGDCDGRIVEIAKDMQIPNPRRFVFELTARPETAMLARAYLAAKLVESSFEAVNTLAKVVGGEKISQAQWQAVNFVIDKVYKEDRQSGDGKPLEQMSAGELQAFIEAKQAERRKLELQASKAEDLKAGQAQPVERADDTQHPDIFGD